MMISTENLIQKVMVHDIDNWIKETKSLRYQNSWDSFKRNIQDGDQIWSYSLKENRNASQGYCILRNGKITNAFETARQ